MTAAVAPRVIEAIAALGDNPDAIAARLLARGIKGRPLNCDTCPLARYIQTIPGAEDAYVGSIFAHLRKGEESVVLTGAAARFRSDFDRGLYPDLIDRTVKPTTEPRGGWAEQIEGGEAS